MKKEKITEAMGNLSSRHIIEAAEFQTEKNPHSNKRGWIKWVSVAACFCLLVSAIIIPLLREGDPSIMQDHDNNGRYKDFTIHSSEYGIVWPWKYKTIYEKYDSINVEGAEFIGRKRELSVNYVGEKLGNYKATGYDDTSDRIYHENFDVYAIKGVSFDRLIAVKMEERYYVFIAEEYDPPATLGEAIEVYSLLEYIELGRFSVDEDGKDKTYHLLNDDEFIWGILTEAENAEAMNPVGWHENKGNTITFTITSEPLGVYKRAMYIAESGYVWTNAFDREFLYFIGKDTAAKIMRYAKENSTEGKNEAYNKTLAGKVIEITDNYILIDDSVLCKDPEDGIKFKVMIDDIKVSRYVDNDIVKVGSMVVVAYEGDIDEANENTIHKIVDISEAIIAGGDVLIPE